MPRLLLIPLEDTVVFPGMEVTLPVDPGDESQVFLVPRHESDYASVGVVAEVGERMRLPGRIRAVQLSALHRGVAGAAQSDPQGRLWVDVEERPDETPPPSKTRELLSPNQNFQRRPTCDEPTVIPARISVNLVRTVSTITAANSSNSPLLPETDRSR